MSDCFSTQWTIVHQAPLSMGFSRQEYWSGLPFPSPGDLPDPGIESTSAWRVDPLPLRLLRRSYHNVKCGPSLNKGGRKTKFTWNQRRVRKAGEVCPVSINKLVVFLVSTKLDTHQRPIKKRVQEWSGRNRDRDIWASYINAHYLFSFVCFNESPNGYLSVE